MLQAFHQYRDANDNNPILGVRLYDYMSNLNTICEAPSATSCSRPNSAPP